jgi:hypothetical protein
MRRLSFGLVEAVIFLRSNRLSYRSLLLTGDGSGRGDRFTQRSALATIAVRQLLRLGFLGLLRLVMADHAARRGTGYCVSAADFVARESANSGPFRRAGGLLVAVTGRMCTGGEGHEHGSQYDTSHRNLRLWSGVERYSPAIVADLGDDRSVLLQICPAEGRANPAAMGPGGDN